MNRLPSVADTSHGMWRRIVMIPFYRTFDDKSRIRDLKDRLDKELSGIFNWTLEGYARLQAEGHFSHCRQADELKGNYQFESNKVRLFIDDCCTVDQQSQVSSGTLYRLYSQWAKLNGYRIMSSSSFKQEMESLRFFYKHSGKRFYCGLQIDNGKCKQAGVIYDPWGGQQPLP
jgi:putative DNA primase/helicase